MEKRHELKDEELENVAGGRIEPSFGPCPEMPKGSGPGPDEQECHAGFCTDDKLSEMDAG